MTRLHPDAASSARPAGPQESPAIRGSAGAGRPYPPDTAAAVQALVTGTALSYREIAARTGVSSGMACRWARTRGWRRPEAAEMATHAGATGSRRERAEAREARRRAKRMRGERERDPFGRVRPPRALGRVGRPYRADAVWAVQRLVEGTALPYRTIALRTGISIETIGRWRRLRGWHRPGAAAVPTGAVPVERAGSSRRRRALARRAGMLAAGWLAALERAPGADPAVPSAECVAALDLVRRAGRLAIRKPPRPRRTCDAPRPMGVAA